MNTNTANRKNYVKPAVQEVKYEASAPTLVQTSYHYQPGWDD